MKKMMMICLFLLGITAVSHAQGRRMSTEDRVKQLKTDLKLTDDQVAKATVIYDAQTKSIDSLRSAGGDRSAFRPIMQATNDKVKAILTPEQAATFDKMMAERRARMQNGGGAPSNK